MANTYTESQKKAAVRAYLNAGTFQGAEPLCGVPWQTIVGWKRVDAVWWDRTVAEQALFLLESLTEADEAAMRRVRSRIIEKISDRIENGDEKLNVKNGTIERVQMQGKELATVLQALGGAIGVKGPAMLGKSADQRHAEFEQIAADDQKGLVQ